MPLLAYCFNEDCTLYSMVRMVRMASPAVKCKKCNQLLYIIYMETISVELKYQLLEAKLAEQKDRIDNIYLLMREDNKGSQNGGS